MIEKLHRYRTLLVLGLILVAAAFVFGDFYGGRQQSATGLRSVLGVAGKTYNSRDFQKLADGPVSLGQMMLKMGDFSVYQFVFELAKGGSASGDMREQFFVGRVILRNARDEFGIHPNHDEVSEHIRTMRAFAEKPDDPRQNPMMAAGGPFVEKEYREFIDKTIGRLGMTENDFHDLVADMLALSKLKAILGSGITADRDAVVAANALTRQRITAELARLDLAPFEDKLQPAEEEIKAYWEPIKDGFKTELRRKFTYLLISPVFPPDPAMEPEPKETLADATLTAEAKEEARKKREDEKAQKAAAYADTKRKIQFQIDTLADDFNTKLVDELEKADGKTFDQLVEEYSKQAEEALKDPNSDYRAKWEVKTTDLFVQSQPPAELTMPVRASSSGGKVVDALFAIHPVPEQEATKFTLPIPVGEGQWLVGRLDGEEKVREQTYGEARADARAKLIEEKATADMKAAAEAALAKVKEAVAAGKTFAEAAKEAGLLGAKTITDLTSSRRVDQPTEPANLFQDASKVDPGSFAEVIVEPERAFILRVVKREVVREANAEMMADAAVNRANNENETFVFDAWLAAKVEDAKVDQLYKHQ
jgi:hypothetical protein